MISTEALLTDTAAFGISTASAAQRAICRIVDGQPLGDLADHPDVLELVGGVAARDALPSESGVQPTEVIVLAAIRCAKTILACAAALRMTQLVDLSRLGAGEIPRVSIVSLKLDIAQVAYNLVLGTLRASPVLSPLVIDDTADVITVRHPSGRAVEIACVAGAKAGGGLVARWSAGVVFDEAPRMNGANDAVVNLDHARTAVIGRLLPGAQILHIGSPWAPMGPIYELTAEHWAKPSPNIVVVRGTGPMLNPQWWTPARCAKLQEQDHTAYQCDVLGQFADPESGLMNPDAVHRNTRETPLELPPDANGAYVAAVDPSEGSAAGNGWTLCIVQSHASRSGNGALQAAKFRVALAREWRGLRPEQLWAEVSALCARYGIDRAWTDQYAASANQDLARRYGLALFVDKTTATTKLETFTNLATLVHSDCVELPPDRQFTRDILSIRKRITQSGTSIVLPKTSDGRHADYAPALALALAHASKAVRRGDMRIYGIGESRYSHEPNGGRGDGTGRKRIGRGANQLTQVKAGSLARLRALLRLPLRAPLSEVAAAIERGGFADQESVDRVLAAVTGVGNRADAVRVLLAGERVPPPEAA